MGYNFFLNFPLTFTTVGGTSIETGDETVYVRKRDRMKQKSFSTAARDKIAGGRWAAMVATITVCVIDASLARRLTQPGGVQAEKMAAQHSRQQPST